MALVRTVFSTKEVKEVVLSELRNRGTCQDTGKSSPIVHEGEHKIRKSLRALLGLKAANLLIILQIS
jgi:hypothetical protein